MSRNLVFESISRVLIYVSGLVSSALLARTLDLTSMWTTPDFADLKVLMSYNQLVLVFVLLGLTTAVIKIVSENSRNRVNIGRAVTLALTIVTIGFTIVAIVTTYFADALGFLAESTPAATAQMRLLWILVLIGLLPSAYISIVRSAFAGMQRRLQLLILDVALNSYRIMLLIYLFLSSDIATITVLFTYAAANILAFAIGGGIMYKGFKSEHIKLTFTGVREISGPFLRICAVFAGLSFISTFFNSVTILFVDAYGTPLDVTRFSWAQSTSYTIRSFLYAPFAVLLPNLAAYNAYGEKEEVRNRFAASNRVLIPSFLFAFIALLTFGDAIIAAIYGVRALDISGGYPAYLYLQIMSANLIVIPLAGIYSNFLTAIGRLKIILLAGSSAVVFQTLWIVLLQPFFGVVIIALSWISYVPVFVVYHLYCRNRLGLSIESNLLVKSIAVALVFLPIASVLSQMANVLLDTLLFIPIFSYTTFYAIVKALMLVPLWYLFIGFLVIAKITNLSDLENFKKVLKKIPPAWWVSRPIFNIFEKHARSLSGNALGEP